MTDDDPLIRRLREQMSDNDRALVDAINRRLELVAQMWDYKRSRGLEVIDAEREDGCCATSRAQTAGRSTQQGLEELFRTVIELTKAERAARRRRGLALVVLALAVLDGELVGRDVVEELRNFVTSASSCSSFTASPSNSIADSSITRSAAKIGASARIASAIASDGRESTSSSSRPA